MEDSDQEEVIAEFLAHRRQQLHADTDAQERRALFQHFLTQHRNHAWYGGKPAHAIGKGPHAWKNNPLRIAHNFRVGGGNIIVEKA